jgi:flavin reductase (DIM6/NTAB) family NADH-FMN oxidoreductase RutF
MPSPTATFNELMSELDYPMVVVTVAHEGQRAGCLVGFATQCSIDPPRYLVCLSKANRTYRLARDADALAVHFVPAGGERLAELFGGQTGDETDKFARSAWRSGPGGVPLLDACPSRFVGAVRERADVGDHVAFVLDPTVAEHDRRDGQFTFHRAKRIEPGHPA